jgi:haloalkane dehalogenase
MNIIRTPDSNFSDLQNFPYAPNYFDIDGVRMHYVDEGPKDAPVALLMHGMPTWSYLYRNMIPQLRAAGYRCVAPDHIGFGRSDKVTDPDWYNIARHTANITRLVNHLNLNNITLFVQDWGGPTGLAQYATMPERFSRLVIMNTWLHHAEYEYSPGIQNWITQNLPGGIFRDNVPSKTNWGTLMAISSGRISAADSLYVELGGGTPDYNSDAAKVKYAYDAPFAGLGDEAVTGPRRFPLSIPFHDPMSGNAVEQEKHFAIVNSTSLPVHFIWGDADNVFTIEWGKKWHSLIPGSTFDVMEGAGHFLQDSHGPQIVEAFLSRIANEN